MVRPSTIHPIGFRHSPQTRNAALRRHENAAQVRLHEMCNILEALYNLRITLNAADDETAAD